jgi:hypothetical protein
VVTLIWRTDVHLADDPPQSRTDDWTTSILDKVSQIGQIAKDTEATAVLDGGDFFHVKSPSRNSHNLVGLAAAVHAGYPCPVYSTIGNHDVKYGNSDFLNEAPLGTLFSTGVFRRLYDQYEAVFTEGVVKVRVVGIPYHGTKYDMNRFTGIVKGDEDFLVVIAHVLANSKGGTLFEAEDVVSYSDLVNLDPDVWCFLPGTKIITRTGAPVSIETVTESMFLSGRSGTTPVVEEVHPTRQVDEEVVLLDVEGIPSELISGVTKEHPFWVAKGMTCRLPSRRTRRCHPDRSRGSYPCSNCTCPPTVQAGWHSAGKILEGDYVGVPIQQPSGVDLEAPGLARLLGLYVAEGHVIKNRGKEPVAGVGWSFHEGELRLHTDVQTLVQQHFGLTVHPHPNKTEKSVQLCAYGTEVAGFFRTHGGRLAEHKILSSWVWDLTTSSRLEVLLGWLDGDGHARNPDRYDRIKSEVMGATASPALAVQMFQLALSVGLRPCYTIRPAGEVTWPDGRKFQQLPCHCISFYAADAEMLAARMGVLIPRRTKTKVSGFFADGMYWARVKGVSLKHYSGPVFNMRTSTQEYVAGLLLTHNCFGHWHKDQGITRLGNKTFVNVGSVSRGSLSQDDLTRLPAVVALRFPPGGPEAERINLKVRPSAEVFDIAGRERMEARDSTMEDLVDSLKDILTMREGPSLLDHVRQLPLDDVVKERALSYLEQAGAK